MKKIFAVFLIILPLFSFAQMQVVVDSAGKLAYPSEADFKSANDLANFYGVQFVIEISEGGTDCEIKAFMRLNGVKTLVYWVSTQWGAQMGADYTTHPAADLAAKIYYTSPENEINGAGKGREWIEYVHNDVSARTLYEHAQGVTGVSNPTIGGIIIRPNWEGRTYGGRAIKDIFSGANECVFLECSPMGIAKTAGGYPIWKPTVPVAIYGGAE